MLILICLGNLRSRLGPGRRISKEVDGVTELFEEDEHADGIGGKPNYSHVSEAFDCVISFLKRKETHSKQEASP